MIKYLGLVLFKKKKKNEMNTFIQQGHIQLNLEYYKIFKFQIIPVLFNFLFIKESKKNITVIIIFS